MIPLGNVACWGHSALLRLALVGALGLSLAGCMVGRRPAEVPQGPDAAVLVGSAALMGPLRGTARHPWISYHKAGSQRWERWEVMCCPKWGGRHGTVRHSGIDPLDDHGGGGGDVRIHAVWREKRAERIISCVEREAPRYRYRDRYGAWPGPNSNTFVEHVARRCHMSVTLPSTAIGRDFRGRLAGLSLTSERTGIQLETALAGVRVGIKEGVELHLLGLAWGVDVWPPALVVPFGSGRVGFDDR